MLNNIMNATKQHAAQAFNSQSHDRELRSVYFPPRIECVRLDNEISLALESAPPIGPNEEFGFNQSNPLKHDKFVV